MFDKRDKHHKEVTQKIRKRTEVLYTSNYVVDELITLFRARGLTFSQFSQHVDSIWDEKVCNLLRVSNEEDRQAWKLMETYKEHPFSFTDCTSFALMKNFSIKKFAPLIAIST